MNSEIFPCHFNDSLTGHVEEKRLARVTFGAPATYGFDLQFVILCHKPKVWCLVGTKCTPESKPCPRIWFLGSIFRFWRMLLNSGTCFVSAAFFWISGNHFVIWGMFWILGSVLSLQATVQNSENKPLHVQVPPNISPPNRNAKNPPLNRPSEYKCTQGACTWNLPLNTK